MVRPSRVTTVVLTAVAALVAGCDSVVDGTATWPGATLAKVALIASDFPPGTVYERIIESPDQPDNASGPAPMLSDPPGCTDGMTKLIAASADQGHRGPGSAAKYSVMFDGARMTMTVLSWNLDLAKLDETAARCAQFEAFFDAQSDGVPITTTKLPADTGELRFQQTMTLGGEQNSVYMAFANIGQLGLIGMASAASNSQIEAKAVLPQSFWDTVTKQSERMRAA